MGSSFCQFVQLRVFFMYSLYPCCDTYYMYIICIIHMCVYALFQRRESYLAYCQILHSWKNALLKLVWPWWISMLIKSFICWRYICLTWDVLSITSSRDHERNSNCEPLSCKSRYLTYRALRFSGICYTW